MDKERQTKAEVVQDIVLGYGKFHIGDIPIAYTRGGGQFLVEREIRPMEADGMKSIGEGMIIIDRESPKLTMNTLSMLGGVDFTKLYPALQNKSVTTPSAGTSISSTDDLVIKADDYQDVKWVGKTHTGKGVTIIIKKAINLENIDWTLADKDEVIQALTYTGVAPTGKTKADWEIIWATPAA